MSKKMKMPLKKASQPVQPPTVTNSLPIKPITPPVTQSELQIKNVPVPKAMVKPPPPKIQSVKPMPYQGPAKEIKKVEEKIAPGKNMYEDDAVVEPPKVERAKEVAPYNLEANLKLTIKAQKKVIQFNSKEEQLLPILVNVKTEDKSEEQEGDRPPIDLICVIDHSGSMAGEKIALVRNTLKNLLEFTNQYDRICLIQFDDRADQLTPLLRNIPKNLPLFQSKINSLRDAGGTNIDAGMRTAFNIIKHRKSANPVTSIFLLTDGIDGGAFNKVQASLAASGLHDQSFTVSCFGFGNDHDEQLLVQISKLRDGSFYYIEKLDTVDESFADALGGLMSVVAKEASIYVRNVTMKPFDGIRIKNTFGDKWIKQGVTSGYEIKLSQVMSGIEKGFMAELCIPPLDIKVADKERSIVVIEANLIANDATTNQKVEKSATLTIHLINQDEPLGDVQEDGEVLENYFRVKGALSIEQAMNDANIGNYNEGKTKIQNMVKEITMNKKVNQEKLKPLLSQLAQSEQTCEPKVYHAGGKKAMMSKGYAMMEQKPASEGMYQNKMQSQMVNEIKMKKMK